jgi:hypothetical protein
MQTIFTEADLRAAIVQLERKQAEEEILLKAQALVAYESIKPINLIRNTFMEAAESHDLHDNLINSSVGLGAGYLSKVLFQGATNSPVKKLIGTALMFGIKNVIAHNPETVKSAGRVFFKLIRGLLHKKENVYDYKDST